MPSYIDNPWEDVERTIRDVAQDELCDPEGGTAAEKWSEEIATKIAQRVMMHLDGGDYEADRFGLRAQASR
jgi:hypothetical protein